MNFFFLKLHSISKQMKKISKAFSPFPDFFAAVDNRGHKCDPRGYFLQSLSLFPAEIFFFSITNVQRKRPKTN